MTEAGPSAGGQGFVHSEMTLPWLFNLLLVFEQADLVRLYVFIMSRTHKPTLQFGWMVKCSFMN